MGIQVCKDYTLTVADPTPDCFAYFKCDDAAPVDAMVNSVDATYNLPRWDAIPGVSVAGKLGTAIRIGVTRTRWSHGDDAHWVMDGDFTVRFWIYATYDNAVESILWAGNQWQVWLVGDIPSPGQVGIEFQLMTVDGVEVLDSSSGLVLGAWNHVVIWFEEGVGLGMKFNNGAAMTISTAFDIQPYAGLSLNVRGWDTMPADRIDEIGIWKRKLTDAEITYDYNSGTGRTYPDVP